MMLRAYAVYDVKHASYSRPWFVLNDAVAVREFTDAVNDPNQHNQWRKHPEDFALHYLGSFDDNSGEFLPSKAVHVIQAAALIRELPVDNLAVVN